MEIQFLKLHPCQDRHASNPHMSWALWAPQCQCLLAEMPIALCGGVREKKIYWTCKASDTWEIKTNGSDCSLSWYFWHFETAIDTTGKVSFAFLFLLDKMEERKQFFILFLSHHLTSLDGKRLFYSTWILTTTSYTGKGVY